MRPDEVCFDPGSFQDRDNRIFYYKQRVCRVLGNASLESWKTLSANLAFERLVAEKKVIASGLVQDVVFPKLLANRVEAAIIEHEKIPCISYPYEWCFSMLKEAALLQLELLIVALDENMILKDASPYNIQWQGTSPIFIDVFSFEPLLKGNPWIGYHQFCELFLYPLFLQAYKNVSFQPWLKGNISGIPLEDFKGVLSFRDYLHPGVFTQVILPYYFQKSFSSSRSNQSTTNLLQPFHSLKDTRLLIKNIASRLQKLVQSLDWKPASGLWQDYSQNNTYTEQDWQQKICFVTQVVQGQAWEQVWDLGCNTGFFSKIASANAGQVLALDADHASIENLWKSLKSTGHRNILPLLFNIADPSPGLGWLGTERSPLPERGKPDLILCLALIHHLVIQKNIPIDHLIHWFAGLNAALVIEFVSKEDSMVSCLLRHKSDQYTDYEQNYFEHCLMQHFDIEQKVMLNSKTRILYYAVPKMRYS